MSFLVLSTDEHCDKSPDGVGCEKVINAREDANKYAEMSNSPTETAHKRSVIHLSVVACGDRMDETLVMIKSASLMNRAPVHVHIFAEDQLQPQFKQHIDSWPEDMKQRLSYTLYPIQYPEGDFEWKKLFKTCSSQRLFIPDILKDIDSMLYVDTDVLFMRPIDDIWSFLEKFNATQIAAVSPEHEEGTAAWYSRFARHPYVPPHGVNSGVMLMNMTRMRKIGWLSHIIPFHKKHRYDITWGDQDLINIYFHHFPEQLYLYSCNWNYRPDHCMYMSTCKVAEEKGVSVLHGCRSSFQNDKQPAFRAIYQAIRDYEFGAPLEALLENISSNLREIPSTPCGRVSHLFTQQFSLQVKLHNSKMSVVV